MTDSFAWDDALVPDHSDLRYYQREALLATKRAFESGRSALCVMATGLGKTQVFAALARDTAGRVLVLAHRDELVDQAARRLHEMTGETIDIEKADSRADGARIVVASCQTLALKHRLEAFSRDHFELVVFDECHHAPSKTWRRPLEWFECRKLGVTATPDRHDEKALGQLFDSVAYTMDIAEGIEQGFLVPIRGRQVVVDSIDLSGIEKHRGDLVSGQLDEAMLRAVEGILHEMLRLEPARTGILFFPGTKSAQYAHTRLQALGKSSCYIDARTPEAERRATVAAFRAGAFQYLCNCQIATEGFDAPSVSLIVMGRPTLSRALYAQMAGRGTRTLPGTIDALQGRQETAARRAAIAASAKPDLMLLDFVGNSGKHALICPADILGGDFSAEEVERAKALAKTRPTEDQLVLLEVARAQLQAVAREVKARVSATSREFFPFQVLHINQRELELTRQRWGAVAATAGQLEALKRAGLKSDELDRLDKAGASKLLAAIIKRRELGLASYKQLAVLSKFGVAEQRIHFTNATRAIDYLASVDWSRPRVDSRRLLDILRGAA